MKHTMQHDLPQDQAKRVAECAFDAYREKYSKYNPTLTWISDTEAKASFHAKGVSLTGAIELKPSAISFDLHVPFVLRVFKGKAVSIMERELRYWTDKAKAGEI